MNKALNTVGENGPFVLFLMTMYLLWDKHDLIKYYTFGLFFSQALNAILKVVIQQPIPGKPKVTTRYNIKDLLVGMYDDLYGMPSGHAQFSFYTSMFMYLAYQQTSLVFLYMGYSMFIIYQRVTGLHHTKIQVVVGAIVGSAVAFGVYMLFKKNVIGVISLKPDDNSCVY
jgi:membrane-associated phospholipid phosphatase